MRQNTLPGLLLSAFSNYSKRPCFAEVDLKSHNSSSQLIYSSYGSEFHDRILVIARAMHSLAIPIQARVALCIENNRLFYDFEIAVLLRRAVSVGIPSAWSPDDMQMVTCSQFTIYHTQ